MNVKFKFTCRLCGRTSQIGEKDLNRFKKLDGSFILYFKCPKCHKESGQVFYDDAIEKIEGFEILLREMSIRQGNQGNQE